MSRKVILAASPHLRLQLEALERVWMHFLKQICIHCGSIASLSAPTDLTLNGRLNVFTQRFKIDFLRIKDLIIPANKFFLN
jgi:hypothetical protein